MSHGSNLIDEIHDQFLVCKICYENYSRPKTLTCLHTFCEECLIKQQDAEAERSYRYMLYPRPITCSICRKKTEVPSGGVRRLPDNFLVANLGEVVSRRRPFTTQCEICQPTVASAARLAISKCVECSKMMCRKCVELHRNTRVTQAHSLFDVDVEKDVECKAHAGEVVRFFCEPCEACICVLCTFQEHKGHDVSSFGDGIRKHRRAIESLSSRCHDRIARVRQQLNAITRCEQQIKKAEDQIRDMTIESIAAIRRNERQLLKDLYEVYGEETVAFLKEKSRFKENIDDMATTCKLTDIVLKNNSVEMLLLKREMEERLEVLLSGKLQQLPASIQQRVKVVPARVKLGTLAACVADDDDAEARPMVIVIDDEEEESEEEEEEVEEETSEDESSTSEEEKEKGTGDKEKAEKAEENNVEESARERLLKESANCDRDYFFARIVDAYVQTDDVVVTQVNIDALKPCDCTADENTQTDYPDVEDRATSPTPIDTRGGCMMTSSPTYEETDTMTNETESLVTAEQHQQTTDKMVSSVDKYTNTHVYNTCEKATAAVRAELSEETTDTVGLVELCERATLTDNIAWPNVDVATDNVSTSDKFSHAQEHRENMTSTIDDSDFVEKVGVEAEVLHNDNELSEQVVFDNSVPRQGVVDATGRTSCSVVTQTSLTLVAVTLLPNTIQCNKGTNTSCPLDDITDLPTDHVRSAGSSKTDLGQAYNADVVSDTEAEEPEVVERAPMVTQETSMRRCMTAHDQATCTAEITTANEATSMHRLVTTHDQTTSTVATATADESTTMQRRMSANDQATCTIATKMTDEMTSMNRSVFAHDQATRTIETTTTDEATSMQRLMTAHDQATCTVSTTTVNEATSMDLNTSVDVATLARAETADFGMLKRPRSVSRGSGGQPIRTANKSITTKMFDCADTPTNTPRRKFSDASSGTPEVTVHNRECSPLRVPVSDRASSPFVSNVATQDGATCSQPERSYVDRASSPIRFVCEVGTCMGSVEYVDSACSPVLLPMRDSGSMTERQATSTVATATREITLADSATQMMRIKTVTSGTGMRHVSYIEKETSTRHVLFVNKNVSTENITTADKQTATAVDITAVYRNSIAVSTCRVTRGTCTPPPVVMTTRHTSPPPATPTVHRASSPVLVPSLDKAVSVTRGELREPVDTFQTVGRSTVPLKSAADITTTAIPRLASIDEDSHETSDDDGHPPAPPPPSTPTHSPHFSPNAETRFSFNENLFSAAFARQDARRSTFLGGGGGGGGASTILCTVETATNTSGVETNTTGTCTPPPAETEDKAVCTEAVTVGGKMAECITKLKTVRHRLEQQQPAPTPAVTAAIMADGRSHSETSRIFRQDSDGRSLSEKHEVIRQDAIDASSSDTPGRGVDLSGRQLHRSLARKKRLDLADLLQTSSMPECASPVPTPSVDLSQTDDAANGATGTNGVGGGEVGVTKSACSGELNCGNGTQKKFADGSTNTDISLSMSSTDVDFRYLLTSGRRTQEVSEEQTPAMNGRRQLLKSNTERKSTFEQLRSMMSDRRKSSTEKATPGGSSIATLVVQHTTNLCAGVALGGHKRAPPKKSSSKKTGKKK